MSNLLQEIKREALKNNVPIIEDETALFLKDYIINNNVVDILEIGSATGYSAIFMAEVADAVVVDTIEKNNARFIEAATNIKKVNIELKREKVRIINDDALKIDLKLLKDKYDMIFVDGPKAQNILIVNYFEKLLKEGGAFIVDNIDFHGMVLDPSRTRSRNTLQLVEKIKKFIEWINGNANYHTDYYKKGDGIIVARKETNNE